LVTAYVFMNVKRGGEGKALGLKKLQGVKDITEVYGEFDVIMKVEKKSMDELEKFLVEKIRPLDWVQKSKTMIQAHDK